MRNESTKVEGKAKNHWLHEISIQNEGSRTKKNESRPKTQRAGFKTKTKSTSQSSRNKGQELKPKTNTKIRETKDE